MRYTLQHVTLSLLCLILALSEPSVALAHVHLLPRPQQDANPPIPTVYLPLIQAEEQDSGGDPNGGLLAPPNLTPLSCPAEATPIAPTFLGNDSDAGYTPGNFEVTTSGSAGYRIPLVVAPGTAGLAPELALTFSSQSGNGMAGVGWSIAGLSSISRCPATVARNERPDPVDFDADDQFCLDGQPLVAVNGGVYGAAGTEYRTEVDNLSRIISYGQFGNGPDHFKVWTKAGLIITYGGSPEAQIRQATHPGVLGWSVNRIEDTKGNYMRVDYHRSDQTGEQYPRQIEYTGNETAGLLPYQRVEFHYEQRTDVIKRYVSGALMETRSRLTEVKSFANDELLRSYALTYAQGAISGRSRLIQIRECTEDACFPPTQFTWQEGENGLRSRSWDAGVAGHMFRGGGKTSDYRILPGDYNGDGKTDIAAVSRATNEGSGWFDNIYMELSTGDGFTSVPWKAALPGHMYRGNDEIADYQIIPGDYNGDGLTDLAALGRAPSQDNGWYSNIYVELSTGSGFVSQAWTAEIPRHMYNEGGDTGDFQILPGDFDGDGRTDLAAVKRTDSRNSAWYYYIFIAFSRGDHFDSHDWPAELPRRMHEGQGKTSDYRILPGDFNGDGLTDMVTVGRAQFFDSGWRENAYIELSKGDGFVSQPWPAQLPVAMYNGLGTTKDYQILPGDYNGDGLTDLAAMGRATVFDTGWRENIYVELSTGNAFSARTWPSTTPGHMYQGNADTLNFRIAGGDFNSDGLTDLVTVGRAPSQNNAWFNHIFIDFSTADGFNPQPFAAVTPQHMYNGGSETTDYQMVVGNFDGDGKPDLATFSRGNDTGNGWTQWAAMELSMSAQPDRLITIADGHGKTTSINYTLLTDKATYDRGSGAAYPLLEVQGPMAVVASYTTSNGVGGTAQASYRYAELRMELRGRGSTGFRQSEMVDEQTQIRTHTTYRQDFPFIGRPVRVERRANGKLVSVVENTWAGTQGDTGKTFLIYLQRSVEQRYELDGKLIKTTTTTNQVDGFGNVTRIDVEHSDGWRQTTVNTYDDDLERWLLGRLVRSEVTAQAPGQPAQKRTSAFVYDETSGLLIREITEPDRVDLQLIKEYTHDVFGNILTSTTSGADIQQRTQRSEYDARGQFAVKVVNALNHQETRTYDSRSGQILTTTGPNGLTTRYEYDTFGRLFLTEEPNGVTTHTWHYLCQQGECPAHAVTYSRTERQGVAPTIEYADLLGRVVRSEALGFDGRSIYVDTEYDNQGRITRSSEPYFAGETALWTTFQYDDLGRVIQRTLPDGSTSSTEYKGLVTRATNQLGQINTRTIDSQDNLVQSTDADLKSINYTYDSFGNLLEVVDPLGHTTALEYDVRGRKIRMVDPDTGISTYRYDILGNLLTETNANGQQVTIRYDLLGRPLERSEPEGTTYWRYDSATMGIGKLAGVEGSDGYAVEFRYDGFGRSYQTLTTMGDATYSNCTEYDSFNRAKVLTYPTGFAVENTYNQHGYLSSVVDAANSNQIYWQLDSMNARGQIVQQTLGNGLSTRHSYDAATGLIDTILTGPTNQSGVQNQAYTFDALGNLTTRSDRNQNLTETFGYDTLNRLTTWQVSGQPEYTASYDVLGNLTFRSDVGNYLYGERGAGPHAVTTIQGARANSYSYDAAGNRLTSSDGIIAYTSFNKPHTIFVGDNEMTFAYTPDRALYRQTTKRAERSVIVYVLGLLELEVSTAGVVERHYISGGNGVVARYERRTGGQRNTHYLHRDHLGSVDTITDENGEVVERLSYDAWGQRRLPNWQTPQEAISAMVDRGFTGHRHLDAVGLIHMGGRVYDPAIGRFLSADPFVQAPENTQNLNRYTYVLNNPLSYTDPSGFIFDKIADVFKDVADWIGDHWKTVVTIGVSMGAMFAGGPIASFLNFASEGFAAAVIGGASSGFAGGFSGALLHGGSFGEAFSAGLGGALPGAISAGLFNQAGTLAVLNGWGLTTQIVAHGVVGGVSSVLEGGRFEHGFLSGAFTAGFAGPIDRIPGHAAYRVAAAAIVGGTAAELGGGKFSNGAITGAFSRMFNHEADHEVESDVLFVESPCTSSSAVYCEHGGKPYWEPTGRLRHDKQVEGISIPLPSAKGLRGRILSRLSLLVDFQLRYEVHSVSIEEREMQPMGRYMFDRRNTLRAPLSIVPIDALPTGRTRFVPVEGSQSIGFDHRFPTRLCFLTSMCVDLAP